MYECSCEDVESCNRFNGSCVCNLIDQALCDQYVETTQPDPTTQPSTTHKENTSTGTQTTSHHTTSSKPVSTLSPGLSTGQILGTIVGVAVVIFIILLLLMTVLGIISSLWKKKMRINPSFSTSFLNYECSDLEGGISRPSSAVSSSPTAPPQVFCRSDPPPTYDEVVTNANSASINKEPDNDCNGTERLITSTTL